MASASPGAIARLLSWRRLRRSRREAKVFTNEVAGLLKKHGHKLKPADRAAVDAGLTSLRDVLTSEDEERILGSAASLDTLVDKHLGFARKSTFREYVESIGTAVLIALVLRAFVIEAFKIPSGSMIPTLRVGDHIFVNKFSYGLRMPFTKWWFYDRDDPQRGDVVVFMFPEDEDKDFIKRIVGVPGDTIQLRQQKLLVTDSSGKNVGAQWNFLTSDFRYEDQDQLGTHQVRAHAVEEGLGEHAYTVIFRPDFGRPDFGPVQVQPGHVFVMGDNRDNSHDARFWGKGDGSVQVPMGNIKGKAMFIWWSSFDVGRIGDWIP